VYDVQCISITLVSAKQYLSHNCVYSTVLRGRDPSAVAVLLEDSAAVTGILMAGAALWLSHITGNSIYDACGSIAIGGTCYYCIYCIV